MLLLALFHSPEGSIPYSSPPQGPLTLEVFRPPSPGPHPGVVFLHGGGWRLGDLRSGMSDELAEEAARAGFVAATINYRLTPHARWPAPFADAGCAVRWMRGHAVELGVDPARIAVVGHSAGAQLALMLAEASPPAEGCTASDSATVAAAVGLAAPTDLGRFYDGSPRWAQWMTRELLGVKEGPTDAPDAYRAASPIAWVDAEGPPVLLVHGEEDSVVALEGARAYAAAVTATGRRAELVVLPGLGHNFAPHRQGSRGGEAGFRAMIPLWLRFLREAMPG